MPKSLNLNIPPRHDVDVALKTLAREDHKRAVDAQEGFERYYKPEPWRWVVALRQLWNKPPRWLYWTVVITGCLTIIAIGWLILIMAWAL